MKSLNEISRSVSKHPLLCASFFLAVFAFFPVSAKSIDVEEITDTLGNVDADSLNEHADEASDHTVNAIDYCVKETMKLFSLQGPFDIIDTLSPDRKEAFQKKAQECFYGLFSRSPAVNSVVKALSGESEVFFTESDPEGCSRV